LNVRIFFTPSALLPTTAPLDDIYIVVDAIRCTTTLSVIFEQGALRVFVAGSIEQARWAAKEHPGRILCGERNARAIPGFDYSNSPVQFSTIDLAGRELILTTTNGTRAFYACPQESILLAGSFYNARAVAAHALELGYEQNKNIAVVCSGELDYFALDDATCAGYIAHIMQQHHTMHERTLPKKDDGQTSPLHIHESVEAAIALFEVYKPPKIMNHCNSARSVIEVGLIDDVYFCMQMSKSECIPVVVGKEEDTGLWILERI